MDAVQGMATKGATGVEIVLLSTRRLTYGAHHDRDLDRARGRPHRVPQPRTRAPCRGGSAGLFPRDPAVEVRRAERGAAQTAVSPAVLDVAAWTGTAHGRGRAGLVPDPCRRR